MVIDKEKIANFENLLKLKKTELYRDFSWRRDTSPYMVFISELMLQQTQTGRVEQLIGSFLAKFPDFQSLAFAKLEDLIIAWQGFGYNRRARYLHESAQKIMRDYGGTLPLSKDLLMDLPGIGPNSAASILVYAFNRPLAFVETNIRTVYIKHFKDEMSEKIADTEILELVTLTLDKENPREFFWGLMDYGVYIKKEFGNLNRQSKSYSKQSKFKGSAREVRGRILKVLMHNQLEKEEIFGNLGLLQTEHYEKALEGLVLEGLISEVGGIYRLGQ